MTSTVTNERDENLPVTKPRVAAPSNNAKGARQGTIRQLTTYVVLNTFSYVSVPPWSLTSTSIE